MHNMMGISAPYVKETVIEQTLLCLWKVKSIYFLNETKKSKSQTCEFQNKTKTQHIHVC